MAIRYRLLVLILLDSFIVMTAIYLSSYLLYDTFFIREETLYLSSITLLVSHHIFAVFYGLYQKAWEYASIGELQAIFNAVTLSILLTGFAQYYIFDGMLLRALLVTWMLHILLIGGSRFSWRIVRDQLFSNRKNQKRTLIIGAGDAGSMVARQLFNNNDSELRPVAFIDDDPKKKNLQLYGVKVVGTSEIIEKVIERYRIEHVIIAIPSLEKSELNQIFDKCSKTEAKTQILPKIEDIMTGKVSVNQFRDVQVEDLLGRDPISLDLQTVSESITNQTVLVTGAGGSIGSEICRQIAKFDPAKLVLLGHGENSIYQIDMELKNRHGDQFEIIPVIADVQDRERIHDVLNTYTPDVIYHAAAHKHVPLMEVNPKEAIKNNVFGTINVADAADVIGVKTFVLVSTDKAVNPTNIMGATKRLAEMVVQSKAAKSNTKFVAVRFGNVLGSRGSVIPLFKRQIQMGGPVTVTDPEMTRYFMTIPEASRLVIQAGSLARGGEIFVLDMGEPVKIVELAENLIRLSGYKLEEIGIEFTGKRPGEKMYEELLGEDEVTNKEIFPKIYIGKATFNNNLNLESEINQLMRTNEQELKPKVMKLIKMDRNNIYSISN
ncbi:nucleoside-diphosphate sugar epimerase/dehydratase [Aquisalibacillus elongatus]|uniref:FlaA1/EpsC-like NDP-sugar epimerase n=1 Tax=Aquisalibacillus elongatus TaxID=485577 RepID=A0A3N5BWR8_9BACI|nr:nucleoside-diphosphate sugar epimerase/dehydratase [Aquisalibacillus elongatus]RPF54198.1 FlaA1/EpsC-like NDP-sugar epimerase [Aquisalibacillus elongatus]